MEVGRPAAQPREFGVAERGAEYMLRPGGYVVITNALGQVAIVRTPSGPALPGGGQDAGESPEDAAVREALEECGLQVVVRERIGVADELVFAACDGRHWRKRCTFFRAEITQTPGGGEADHELAWLPAADAVAQLRHESQRWAVSQACGW